MVVNQFGAAPRLQLKSIIKKTRMDCSGLGQSRQLERRAVLHDPSPFRYRVKPKHFEVLGRRVKPRRDPRTTRTRFAVIAGFLDLAMIMACAIVIGCAYHACAYGEPGSIAVHLESGLFLGILFTAANTLGDQYDIVRFLTFAGHARRTFLLWNFAFVGLLLVIFITKTSDGVSRGAAILTYGSGYIVLLTTRSIVVAWLKRHAALGRETAQRIFLVGEEEDIARFTARHEPWNVGLRIVASAVLRGPETMADDLALAAASARMLRPDDIFVLMPWAHREAIDSCVAAFMRVPAAIHLGPEQVLDRFADARISRIGTIASLNLVRHPLTRTEIIVKRAVDAGLAGILLVVLLPLFLLVVVAIKLDSRGPVLFTQRRYGFNQEPFRIVKFRSMSTMEEGRAVSQAVRNDVRVTRIGRLLRRFNIDELPQLLNVLRGDMSLVGPRPHALAHDQLFERKIADYARRHNVKPGITGWAQVNGYRGPILAESAMRHRVEHDLFYIDNWSMILDCRILLLTLFSRKAFENAL